MKRIFTIAAALLMTASVWAQSPEKMSYQAVVRDASNALVATQSVGMQISLLQGGATGTPVYVETQTPTTNANGLVSLEIGTGILVSGDFTTIDWANDTYFIKTEIDPTGGSNYTITGVSQLMSVPYALHAKTADNGITLAQANEITANTAKVGLTTAQATILGNTSGTNTGDQTVITTAQASEITANTAKNSEADGTSSGDMKYWNGTAWIMIPTTVNEGATLQLISGVPTWTGGSVPIVVGSQVEGGIVYKIFQSGDAGYVVGETHGMVASATQGASVYGGSNAFIITLNTGTYSNWTMPTYGDLGTIRANLMNAGVSLNFFDNTNYHWSSLVDGSGCVWTSNIGFGTGPCQSAGLTLNVLGVREF